MLISRNILTTLLFLITISTISFLGGFFYKYQPQQEQLKVTIEQPLPVEDQNTFHSGIITKIEDNIVFVTSEQVVNEKQNGATQSSSNIQNIKFSLQGISIEHLKPLKSLNQLHEGMQVVVGGERYYAEKVINGVVFFKGNEK
ncbi:MAG: hypothetical protein CL792_05495 [Chloroflexi bacterium]|nr:hypothetical protein [Chloroflexota bacterium]